MDAALFTKMLSDKSMLDLKKMKYKYSSADVAEMISLLQKDFLRPLPLKDFKGNPLVYLENFVVGRCCAVKRLLAPATATYGLAAMEEEIHSTFSIENIDTSRDSIRRILRGYAPIDSSEYYIHDMKQGLSFIANRENKITRDNLHRLYTLVFEHFLDETEKLHPGNFYRHDGVFVVGGRVEHAGLPHEQLPAYMDGLLSFIQAESGMDDLVKAAVIHFYLAFLHPYFDGNGRMARLIHLWYLIQQGYSSTLFFPFSAFILANRRAYYNAFGVTEANAKISGTLDVTPFIAFYFEQVYDKLQAFALSEDVLETWQSALEKGKITAKEKELWEFVRSAYGNREFSTKQLEKDFGNAAYATIRDFVLKFQTLGLLAAQPYGNRTKYRVP